ncbi:hypothetical protein BMF94_5572 [Rhodotorula taiwanensis]|uniref:Guanosine-3',5'-bis(diphosphate) 3'-pyrophosphohydrolase MESH1 n=1 Tax=Rhodotorula taiwanensis TaxID=741276 RepID=A0A2S5B3B4_9BASI|nr:hypothetical protein BMF94_5572 [Rhodotorula taiwanensis]
MSQLLEAAHFAAVAHNQQRRKSAAQPAYIQHPLHVALLLASPESSLYPDPPVEILQAAVLHDTVEDTEVTVKDLEDKFGAQVTRIVMECSDDKHLNKAQRKQAQIDSAPHKSDAAKHVKLADKLSNLRDLMSPEGRPAGWSFTRIQEYFVWAKRVTDACRDVNPGLGDELEKIYREGTFEHGGKTYRCHPSYSA